MKQVEIVYSNSMKINRGNYEQEAVQLQKVLQLDSLLYGSRSRGELLLASFHTTEASGDYGRIRSAWEQWRRAVSGDSVLLAHAHAALGRAQRAAGHDGKDNIASHRHRLIGGWRRDERDLNHGQDCGRTGGRIAGEVPLDVTGDVTPTNL